MGVIVRRNDALEVNPPLGAEQFTVEGSDWLWAVTAIYGFLFLSYYGLSFRARFGEKVFHYIFSITLLTGTIAYFAHAADLGYAVVSVDSTTRQFFWVKYVYCTSLPQPGSVFTGPPPACSRPDVAGRAD